MRIVLKIMPPILLYQPMISVADVDNMVVVFESSASTA